MKKLKNYYSFFGYLKLCCYLFYTKLFFSQARIIRLPVEIRGRKFIDFGVGLTTGRGCRFEAFSEVDKKRMIFGKHVQVNDYVHISAMDKVVIGDNVLMASHIYISDNSHGFYKGEHQTSPRSCPIDRPYNIAPVLIEDNVWIGEGVVVMPGVTIGCGCIIGANSTVTKSIPAWCIAVGQPAKVIKQYDFTQKQWLII